MIAGKAPHDADFTRGAVAQRSAKESALVTLTVFMKKKGNELNLPRVMQSKQFSPDRM